MSAPLQREQLARAQPGAQRAQDPRVPPRELRGRDGDEVRGFLARQRLNRRLRFTGTNPPALPPNIVNPPKLEATIGEQTVCGGRGVVPTQNDFEPAE